jgi:hypothetical protein
MWQRLALSKRVLNSLTLIKMDSNKLVIKMLLDRWNAAVKSWDDLVNAIPDDQLQKEIAAGKNRGIYLLGHIVAVHDNMISLLNLGEKKYPHLNKLFVESPDKAMTDLPSVKELRAAWNEQKQDLKQRFENLKPEEWFEKHTAVSAEDFAKEPHRNKLNILLTRTTHLAYHTGQLILLK